MPAAGVRVVLHQVGRSAQGPLDSVRSDRQGRFRFVFHPDTSALYLLSARYQGIEYFSQPVHTNPERPDTAIRIQVYDTSSTAPIALEARHLVVTRPGEDGSRSVLDLVVLRNNGRLTRVAPDTMRPSWSGPLPPGTIGLEIGESDVSPEAVSRRGDSLIVTAPLAPGEKQITVQYVVPAGGETLQLRFNEAGPMVNVLTEENGVRVTGGSLAPLDSQVIQGRSFRRWAGAVPAAGLVRIALPDMGRAPRWLLPALVAGIALILLGSGWYVLSQRPPPVAPSREDLLDSIAALDARYLGQQAVTPAAEWSAYENGRVRLKAQLQASLAVRGPSQ